MASASVRASELAQTFLPAERQADLPWDRLAEWLRASGHDVGDLAPRQFSGGVANLNYLLKVDGVDVVLRRPPSGVLAEGASDMAREWRVLRSLNAVYPLAPRGISFCDDVSVIGAPFQLIEYRPGMGGGGTVAVVDWDMATTGEPLFDLGVLLAYWVQWDDPVELRALEQVPSLEHGAPDRSTVARGYFDRTGRTERDLSFYFTLGRLRLAIAWQQLYVLHRTGALSDPRYSTFSDIATAVLTWTADTLDESPI